MEPKRLMMDDPDFVRAMQKLQAEKRYDEFFEMTAKAFAEEPEVTARQIAADEPNVWKKLDLLSEVEKHLVRTESYEMCAVMRDIAADVRGILNI